MDIDKDVVTKGNSTLIEILLNNLLINAIRHNQQNGAVRITLNTEGIVVSNSGSSALDSSVIFNRFTKVSGDHSGSGLGLAIIKEICHRHQWKVQYQFENHRHTFSIRFLNSKFLQNCLQILPGK